MTVGIDGGYVRAAHKQGNFEVIAGRSVVAFRRAEGDLVPPPSKCFGFVKTYDQKPRQRGGLAIHWVADGGSVGPSGGTEGFPARMQRTGATSLITPPISDDKVNTVLYSVFHEP
jgi:hypothetical protein